MMKTRFSRTQAAVLAALGVVSSARAEDVFQPSVHASDELCRFGPDGGGCAHFQGYVYVRHAPALAADGKATASDPALSGGRVYLRVDSGEMR